jgi:hypothetical protein
MTGKTRLFAAMILAVAIAAPARADEAQWHAVSLAARRAGHLLHACARAWRSGLRLAAALHDGLVLSKTPLAGSTAAAIKFKAIEKNVEELRANAD